VKAVYALDGKEEEAKYDEEEEEEEEEDKEDEEEEEGEGEDVLVEYKYKSSVEASSFFCVLPFSTLTHKRTTQKHGRSKRTTRYQG